MKPLRKAWGEGKRTTARELPEFSPVASFDGFLQGVEGKQRALDANWKLAHALERAEGPHGLVLGGVLITMHHGRESLGQRVSFRELLPLDEVGHHGDSSL